MEEDKEEDMEEDKEEDMEEDMEEDIEENIVKEFEEMNPISDLNIAIHKNSFQEMNPISDLNIAIHKDSNIETGVFISSRAWKEPYAQIKILKNNLFCKSK